MAGYRQFHTKFWKDEWMIDLDPLERYLFSYLFTNDLSSISGIYKLPIKVIANETGLDLPYIEITLAKFQECKKIFYRDGVMWVVKMQQHHKNASPKTMAKVRSDIAEIQECDVKKAYRYYQETGIYCIDTVSIQVQRSVSLSVSGNKSVSESDGFIDTSPPDPDEWLTPLQTREERIYCAVTNHPTMPAGCMDEIINAIQKIKAAKGLDDNQTVEYLRPFWTAAKLRYTKSSGSFWLTDWAVVGVIPEPTRPNGKNNGHDTPAPKKVIKRDARGNEMEYME